MMVIIIIIIILWRMKKAKTLIEARDEICGFDWRDVCDVHEFVDDAFAAEGKGRDSVLFESGGVLFPERRAVVAGEFVERADRHTAVEIIVVHSFFVCV